MGSKFGFGGQTWVRVSSKLDLSSSKQFEVRYSESLIIGMTRSTKSSR